MSTSAPLRIEPERTRKDRRQFIQLLYRLYKDDPVWVPPLRMAEAALMNRKKNPFFQHATVEHFLARRGKRVVGRIAAIENPRHNEFHEDKIGFFGFFDCEPDQEAATALVEAANAWTTARGLSPMRGPVNYSTNDSCGALVDGFDESPTLLMPYNRPDYGTLLEGAGLVGVKDLLALWMNTMPAGPERFERVVKRKMARSNVTIRPIDLKQFDRDVEILRDLYNRCWERNWGFVPASPAEFDNAASDLKRLVHPAISAIAERDGEPVGFSVMLRDINRVLKKGPRNGRLFPFLWLRLLTGIKKVDHTRCVLLGVVPEARGAALNEAFFLYAIVEGYKSGVPGAECGWVLADNFGMLNPVKAGGGEVRKTYRMYETPNE